MDKELCGFAAAARRRPRLHSDDDTIALWTGPRGGLVAVWRALLLLSSLKSVTHPLAPNRRARRA